MCLFTWDVWLWWERERPRGFTIVDEELHSSREREEKTLREKSSTNVKRISVCQIWHYWTYFRGGSNGELVWCWKHWRHGKRFTIDMVEISPSKMQPVAHMQECWICLHHISWRHSWTINVWTLQQNTRLRLLLIISWSWLNFRLSWLISEALEFLRSFLHGIQYASLGGCWHDMWFCFYKCLVWLSGQSCPLFFCHWMFWTIPRNKTNHSLLVMGFTLDYFMCLALAEEECCSIWHKCNFGCWHHMGFSDNCSNSFWLCTCELDSRFQFWYK